MTTAGRAPTAVIAPAAREDVSAFLAALFSGCPGVVELRALPSGAQHFAPPEDVEAHLAFLLEHRAENVYAGVAARRDASSGALDNCSGLGALFVDVDFKVLAEAAARARLAAFPLPPSIVVHSGGGVHVYWLLDLPLRLPEQEPVARDLLRRLAWALGGDLSAAEPARILRVPRTFNDKYTPPARVTLEHLDTERRYDLAELAAVVPKEPEDSTGYHRAGGGYRMADEILQGERHGELFRFARSMRVKGFSANAVTAALRVENTDRCRPPLPESEIPVIVRQVFTRRDRQDFTAPQNEVGEPVDAEPGPNPAEVSIEDVHAGPAPKDAWPTMAPVAYSGWVGRLVETVAPYSESDPVAILLHALVAAGNLFGPGAYARVERDPHPPRLNVAMVGTSSKGRKGTSWSTPKAVVQAVDPTWRISSGLSTGEGLIFHVRDRVEQEDPKTGALEVVDEGIVDKRVLVMETELSSVLARMSRDGNTLSAVMRDAWDHGQLSTLTRNSPLRATGAHVSVIGHITQPELTRLLTSTEMANGFGNRFLWACVRRAQLLADGGGVDDARLAPLVRELDDAVTAARRFGLMQRDAETSAVWHDVYPDLSRERDGLVGSLLARAEAQTLRLSVLYALLDQSHEIRLPHLVAALAVWAYCEASVLYLWGARLGHPIADTILDELRRRGRLTRTEVRNLLGGRVRADAIEEALAVLERSKLAHRGTRDTGGRPEEYVEAV